MCVRLLPADPAAFAAVRAHFDDTLAVVGSHARLLEIGPPGVSKRDAIAHVAKLRGIDAAHCAAAGDAENDLGMLRWAAVAVTVANAIPEAKQIARFVGPSCDDGGLADGVAWLLSGMAR